MKTLLRPISACLAGLLLLTACAPRQLVYSLDPVDPRGVPLPFDEVQTVRFEDGSSEAIPEGSELRVSEGRLETSDGQVWPLSSIDAIDWMDEWGDWHRTKLRSPSDLLNFDEIPRIRSIRTREGELIEFDDGSSWSNWSEDQLSVEFSPDGGPQRSLALADIHTIRLHSTSIADATVKDWRFYAAIAAAATIIWLIRPDSENLAIQ